MIATIRTFVWEHRSELFNVAHMPPSMEDINCALFHHGRAHPWSKLLCLVTYQNTIVCLVKTVRSTEFNDRVEREYRAQRKAREQGYLSLRVPEVLATSEVGGYILYAEEVIHGVTLSSQETLSHIDVLWQAQQKSEKGNEMAVTQIVEALLVHMSEDLQQRHVDSLRSLTQPLWSGFTHGDLTPRNMLRDSDGRLVVIDWQKGEERPFWGIDLCHLAIRAYGCTDRATFAARLRKLPLHLSDEECLRYEELFVLDQALDALEKREYGAYRSAVADMSHLV